MKRKELIIVIAVGLITAIFSFVISNMIFGTPSRNPIKVPVVQTINPVFPIVQNDDNYSSFFNDKAINPTQLIQIGNNNNTQPFQNGQGQ